MSDRTIQEAIRKLAGTQLADEVFVVECNVDSVDLPTRTCSCTSISGQAETTFPDVRLMATVDDGMLIVPSVNSTVFVTYSKRHSPAIVLFSQIDQVLLVTGSSTMTMQDGLTQLNDGSYGGLIKIQDLVTRLNDLENLVNNFISKFNTHTHSGVSTGGGTSATPVQTQNDTATLTKVQDIENTLITHGK